jgi:kumamolisin
LVAGVAPGLRIAVVFAPNTNTGFIDGVKQCLDLDPDAISISWGGPVDQWDGSDIAALDALFEAAEQKGINVFCAAGDSGAKDGERGFHPDYPACSPFVISCGGTNLQLNSDGTRQSETAWSTTLLNSDGTGGGIATNYPTPNWQSNIMPSEPSGRRSPDVAGNADPATGYLVDIDGQDQQIGGTSAVAPLYAALQILLNAEAGQHIGNLHTKFYANPSIFYDVIEGNNGYPAGPGFDLCTGLGVIDARAAAGVLISKA